MLPVPAGLYIWTGLEAARCAIQLFRHIRTSKAERPGFDEFGNHFRRRGTRALRVLYGTVAGAYPKHRRCRSPVDGKIPAPVHDVEKARDCQKESFEIAFGQEGGSEDRGCRSCMTSLWLVRNLAGILLLYPTCMLVMSGYAATRGLLREFGSWESEVSNDFQKQMNDLLTNFRCKLQSCRNSYSGHHRWCSFLRASSGRCSSIYIIKATPKTISRKRFWVRRSFSDFYRASDMHRVH
jgi:hypothetical protein